MAIPTFSKNMNIIAQLSDTPNAEGMSASMLKGKFDEGGLAIQEFLNNDLRDSVQEKLTVSSPLDPTLIALDADQYRHIYVTQSTPTGASPEGIYLVTE